MTMCTVFVGTSAFLSTFDGVKVFCSVSTSSCGSVASLERLFFAQVSHCFRLNVMFYITNEVSSTVLLYLKSVVSVIVN